MEITVTIKNDSDRHPHIARMSLTIDVTQGVGGIRISFEHVPTCLEGLPITPLPTEPARLVKQVQRQEQLIKRSLSKGRKQ